MLNIMCLNDKELVNIEKIKAVKVNKFNLIKFQNK